MRAFEFLNEGSIRIAGLMTNTDDPNNPTIRDPDTFEYMPTKQYFQSHPEQQSEWQSAWQDHLTKLKQFADRAKQPQQIDPVSGESLTKQELAAMQAFRAKQGLLSPEQQAEFAKLKGKDARYSGRLIKQAWKANANQQDFQKFIKVHWTKGERGLKKFIDNQISSKIELSVNMYRTRDEMNKYRWSETGVILNGHVTLAGSRDLRSDNYYTDPVTGKRAHQKYSTIPDYIDVRADDVKTGIHNEALVDNWKVIGFVVTDQTTPEEVKLIKGTGLPVTKI